MGEQGKLQTAFHLDRNLVNELHEVVGRMKAQARLAGKRLPTASMIVEDALRAELPRLKKRFPGGESE